MRGTAVIRSQHKPLRIEPCFGKLPEYGSEVRVSKETWDVLKQCESRSHLANDSNGLRPEVALVVFASLLSSDGERLAGKARADDIDAAPPLSPVEGTNVRPDGELIQTPISLPLM